MAKLATKYDRGDKQGMTATKMFSAPPQNIKIVEGHNYRRIDPERVAVFAQMYRDGKDVPPVLVALGDNEELELVDGEHRVLAAIEAGVKKIPMVEFSGSKKERLVVAWRFNQGSKGTAVETARAFLRMRNDGYTNADIAKETGASEGTVGNHLLLAMSGDEVMAMVDAGDVAATTVINMARSTGPDKVLAALKKAKKEVKPTQKTKGGSGNKPKRLKDKSVRITSKDVKKPEKNDGERALAYLKRLMQYVNDMEIISQFADDVDTAKASALLEFTCPAGAWRDLIDLKESVTKFLTESEGKK